MKVIKKSSMDFDSKVFTVELTGREVAQIYAGLMNLSGEDFNRMVVGKANYRGPEMHDTEEIETSPRFDLLVNNQD